MILNNLRPIGPGLFVALSLALCTFTGIEEVKAFPSESAFNNVPVQAPTAVENVLLDVGQQSKTEKTVGDPAGLKSPGEQKGLNFAKPGDEAGLNFANEAEKGIIVDWKPGASTGDGSAPAFMNQAAKPSGNENGVPIYMNQGPGGKAGEASTPIYMSVGANKGGNSGVPAFMNQGPGGAGGTKITPAFMNEGARGAAGVNPGLINPVTTSGAPIFMNPGAAGGVPIYMNTGGNSGVPIFMNQGANAGGAAGGRSGGAAASFGTGGGGGAGMPQLSPQMLMLQK